MAARLTTETSPNSQTTSERLSPRLSAVISAARTRERQQQLLRALAKVDGYAGYENEPIDFIRQILGESPWRIQAEIANSVRDHRYTAVPSCFGSGKDWIAARIIAWWVARGGIAVATSNSFPQLRDILWRELRVAHRKGELPGQPSWGNDLRWDVYETAWAIGRKPDDNDPEGLQGIHGARVLVVIDEANGVPKDLFDAVMGLVVNEDSRVLAIGNPYEPVGPFFEACRSANWNVIHISVFDTPNWTGEPVPAKATAELVGKVWLEDRKREGLEGTPWWQAKVLGQFPDTASNAVIPLAWVEAARERVHDSDAREWAGLDVARFGNDDSVRIDGSGNGPISVEVRHGHDTMEVAGLGMAYLASRRGALAIDVIGVGAGVYDRIREQRPPGQVLGVNVAESPERDPDLLVNLRAQLWWDVRLALDPRSPEPLSLARLDDSAYQRLRSELTAPTYRMTSAGKVQVESKEEMKARGLASPDLADAFCLAIYARSRARRRTTFGAAA